MRDIKKEYVGIKIRTKEFGIKKIEIILIKILELANYDNQK